MIDIQLRLRAAVSKPIKQGEIWNVSALAAHSDYDFYFDGRTALEGALLRHYPRWCEPVGALVARCIDLSAPESRSQDGLPDGWDCMELDIALRPGGRIRGRRILSTTRVSHDRNGLQVEIADAENDTRTIVGVTLREGYRDEWELAAHALRMATFGIDELPAPKELDVPLRHEDKFAFVCFRDIPEPARSEFERRMRGSGAPWIEGFPDAVYAWDWLDFLNGNR